MASLVFYEKNHRYTVDGEDVPSVSEITRFISRELYSDVVQFALDNAADALSGQSGQHRVPILVKGVRVVVSVGIKNMGHQITSFGVLLHTCYFRTIDKYSFTVINPYDMTIVFLLILRTLLLKLVIVI